MLRIGQLVVGRGTRQLANSHNNSSRELTRCLTSAHSSLRASSSAATATAAPADRKPAAATSPARPNLSFVANMFRGEVQPREVFPYPYNLTEEQRENIAMFVDPVTSFFTDVNNAERNDDNGEIDAATADAMWDLGAMAFQVPTEYGGMGANNTQYARMGEIVGAYDLGLGICLGAHQSIGFKGILLFGTPEQKQKYLPQVSTGKVYAAFCLTEPSAGSDASSIKCRAALSADGKHWVLNGSKIWISNGGIADVLTVFAQTEVADAKAPGGKRDKVTAFIVERGFGGVSSGPPEKKMGIKASNTTEVYFEDCAIPVENVLGEVGEGFKVAMNILNNGRFGMAGTLSGTMATCIAKATEHATQRVQFGKRLEEYGGVQEKLARMATLQYVTQSMAYMISGNMDGGSQDYHLEAAISKVFASEAAWHVCDEAIQILGGMGFMKATGLERVLRDLRIFRIFEGTNDILRLFVALTGIQYAGANLKELQRAFKNPAANLGLIFKAASGRVAKKVGLGGSSLSGHVDASLAEGAQLCAQSVDAFGQTVESLLLKYGKEIVHEQYLLNRLADCAIDIYAMSVVLSRATRSLEQKLGSAEHERRMAEAWCIEAHDRIRVNNAKIHSAQFNKLYAKQSEIAKTICTAQGVASINPINV